LCWEFFSWRIQEEENMRGFPSVDAHAAIVAATLAVSFVGLEALYFSRVGPHVRKQAAALQGIPVSQVRFRVLPYAVPLYAILLFAVWFFVVRPTTSTEHALPDIWANRGLWALEVLLRSCALALAVWGVYNLTNLALFQKYGMGTAFMDTLWGLAVVTASSFLAFTAHLLLLLFSFSS